MLVHIFGAASSPCCSNSSVQQTAENDKEWFGTEVINTLVWNFYINDVLQSVLNKENVIPLLSN